MTAKLEYSDVFVPGGFPRHTYNPRADLNLEELLGEAKKNLCKLATVTGHTKSGKTVLAKKVFPPEASVWVDGGTVSEESDFWNSINEQLDLFTDVSMTDGKSKSFTVSGQLEAEAGVLIAKSKIQGGGAIEKGDQASSTYSRKLPPKFSAINGLKRTRWPLVVDDFHYIPRPIQATVIRSLKPLIFEGLPVIIIAIPHRRYDSVKVRRR